MSYAEMAAKGPKQSPEEARAAPVPEIEPTETESTSSLVDVDSPHVTSVPSDFEEQSVQTQTHKTRLEHEAEDRARTEEKKLADEAEKAKTKAAEAAKKAKSTVKKDAQKLSENKDNPVVIGNAVVWGLAAVAVGYTAYQRNAEGKLDWRFAGTAAGIVGAFGVADYFVSRWLFENKYPTK